MQVRDWYRKFGIHREFKPRHPNSLGANTLTATVITMGVESREVPQIHLYNPRLAQDGPPPEVIKEPRVDPPIEEEEEELQDEEEAEREGEGQRQRQAKVLGDTKKGEDGYQDLAEGGFEAGIDDRGTSQLRLDFNAAPTKFLRSTVDSFSAQSGTFNHSRTGSPAKSSKLPSITSTPRSGISDVGKSDRPPHNPSLEPWVVKVTSFPAMVKRLKLRYPAPSEGHPGAVINHTVLSPRGGKWMVAVGVRMSLFVFRMRDKAV